ncbi:unnamed protein product, partial [Timema podura]|nr:unnamed protein product [Timema podura]
MTEQQASREEQAFPVVNSGVEGETLPGRKGTVSIGGRTDKNSGLLTIGAVNIDIPQHPVALHGMMTRGSKQLSSTLQELRTPRTSSRISRGTTADEVDFVVQHSPRNVHSSQTHTYGISKPQDESNLLHPLVMQFSIILQ